MPSAIPPENEELSGILMRLQNGFFSRWAPYYYSKQGIFLFEYKPSDDRRIPRSIIVLDGATIKVPTEEETGDKQIFHIIGRNKVKYTFLCSSLENKQQWVDTLRKDPAIRGLRRNITAPAAFLAPVRRRLSVKRSRRTDKVAVVELNKEGAIVSYNDVAEVMFGYPPQAVIGQKVTMLLSEESNESQIGALLRKEGYKISVGVAHTVDGLPKGSTDIALQMVIDRNVEGDIVLNLTDINSIFDSDSEDLNQLKEIINLRISLIEGKNIGGGRKAKKIEKIVDPYCTFLIDGVIKASSSAKEATCVPYWGEDFFFDDVKNKNHILTLSFVNQNPEVKDPRLGQVVIDLAEIPHNTAIEKWFPLSPPQQTEIMANESDPMPYGSARIKLTLIHEKILPPREYHKLMELVLDSNLTIAYALAKVAGSQLEEVAGTLVNIFSVKGRAADFITILIDDELEKTDRANLLFRGNTLATKVVDSFMKMIGSNYLHSTLHELISDVYNNKLSCEVDPNRFTKTDVIEANAARLRQYIDRFWTAIQNSAKYFPVELSQVFHHLYNTTELKFPGQTKYTAVNGFVFLRFFCPAILNPNLFGLADARPVGTAARTLTLIAKVLQNLANLVPQSSEPFMAVVSQDFLAGNLDKMKTYIDTIVNPAPTLTRSVPDDLDIGREVSALFRHLSEKMLELREMEVAKKEKKKFDTLFKVLRDLDIRQTEYEGRASLSSASSSSSISPSTSGSNKKMLKKKNSRIVRDTSQSRIEEEESVKLNRSLTVS